MIPPEALSDPTSLVTLKTIVERQVRDAVTEYRSSDELVPAPAPRRSLVAALRSLASRHYARLQPRPARHATA